MAEMDGLTGVWEDIKYPTARPGTARTRSRPARAQDKYGWKTAFTKIDRTSSFFPELEGIRLRLTDGSNLPKPYQYWTTRDLELVSEPHQVGLHTGNENLYGCSANNVGTRSAL